MADIITTVVDLGTPINVTVEANGAEWVAEQDRRTEELKRVQSENTRFSNEAVRTQAENQRIANENLRKSTVETIEREYAPRLNAVESGSPKGVYDDLQALNTAFSEGNTYTYITSDNGNWNYWDSVTSKWKAGGLYQSVKGEAYNINVNDANNNFDANNVEDVLKEVAVKNQASNALIGKATGELLNLHTAEAKARKFEITAKTISTLANPELPISVDNPAILESVGEGNLFNKDDASMILDGWIEIIGNGRFVENANLRCIVVPISVGEKYVLSNPNGNRSVYGFFSNIPIENDVPLVFHDSHFTVKAPVGAKYLVWYINSSLPMPTNVMVSRGTTLQPYVPYGSFNIYKGDNFNNEINNGNFINTSYWYTYNATNFSVANNQATFIATAQYGQLNHALYVKQNHKYYISSYISSNIDSSVGFAINDGSSWFGGKNITSTATPSLVSAIGIAKNTIKGFIQINDRRISGWTPINVSRVMCIDMGSDESHPLYNKTVEEMDDLFSTWIDYKEPITVSLKDTRSNFIPFRGLETAQDVIFKDTDGLWKLRGNIGRVVFDGKENWGFRTDISAYNSTQLYGFTNPPFISNANGICNSFEVVKSCIVSVNTLRFVASNNFGYQFNLDKNEFPTIDSWKTWLQSNPVEVIYELAEPTEITLHTDAQTVLNQIEQMHDGQTVIYGTDKVAPSFKVEYVKDINYTIDQLVNAIISLGGSI